MISIYRRVMGREFDELHPRLQEHFSLSAAGGIAAICTGTMERVWRGRIYTLPLLMLGSGRNITFPETGQNIPFQLENYAYLDSFGRETIAWNRTFYFPHRLRRFDTTMIYSSQRNRLVDYVGTHQKLAVDIHPAAENGGMRLRSGAQRFYEGPVGFRLPMLFSGDVDVYEWYDDVAESFRIRVVASNSILGKLFGYTGSFRIEYRPVSEMPRVVKPVQEERRE